MTALMLAAIIAAPAPLPAPATETETVIHFAANGGLRDWQAGEPRSGIIFVRDRREQWYRILLSGPCTTSRTLDRLSYTTDTTGTFDRFSRITVGQYPNQVCGVTSIRTSPPPRGQPGTNDKSGSTNDK